MTKLTKLPKKTTRKIAKSKTKTVKGNAPKIARKPLAKGRKRVAKKT